MTSLFAMFGLPGGWEFLILAVVVLLLFGSSRLPSLMRSLGSSVNEFKHGMNKAIVDEDSDTAESE